MKKIYQLLLAVAMAAGFAACSDNWSPGNDLDGDVKGEVRLSSLGVDVSEEETVVSKSLSRASVDISSFIISIVNADGATVAEWKHSEMPGVLVLPVGDYTVNVRSHNVQRAAFDEPYYLGTSTFTIVANEITDLGTVTCRLSNIKVTIKFEDDLKAILEDDAEVTVVANDEGSLVFTPSETRAGYFESVAASTTLVATFEGHIKGQADKEVVTRTYTDATAGTHYRITFKLKTNTDPIPDETGTIVVGDGSIIDTDIEDVTHNTPITFEEDTMGDDDRPGQEDPEKPEDPTGPDDPTDPSEPAATFTSSTLSFTSPNVPADDLEGIVNIHCAQGIKNLLVDISTNNANFESAVAEMVGLSFDLANPGSMAEAYAGLGFPVGAEVVGANDLVFNITDFIPLLAGFDGTHNFKITVIDAKGAQSSVTLTFVK